MGNIEIKRQHIISSMAFPPIVEYAKIINSPNVLIDQHEHYIKRTSRNRFTILSPNGPQCLSIPLVKGKNRGIRMQDVLISYDTNWWIKHLRSIITAYGSAPFFQHYIDSIEGIFLKKHATLLNFNNSALETISSLLNIPFSLSLTTQFYEGNEQNIVTFRDILHPVKIPIKDGGKIIDKYEQVFSDRFDFIPNLSILDLLFCLGPESYSYLKSVYQQSDEVNKNMIKNS